MTGLADEWKAMDIVYLDFRKAFNSLKLLMHMLKELDKQTISLTENWLNQQDLRVVIFFLKIFLLPSENVSAANPLY